MPNKSSRTSKARRPPNSARGVGPKRLKIEATAEPTPSPAPSPTAPPLLLTVDNDTTFPSTPARVSHSLSLLTPLSALQSHTMHRASPFWMQLSPLEHAQHSKALTATNAINDSDNHTHAYNSTAGDAGPVFRPPSTPLDLLSPSTSEATPFTNSDSLSLSLPLSTPRVHKSPQKFTFVTPVTQSKKLPITDTAASVASSLSITSSTSSGSTKRPSYVQRLDFSNTEDESESAPVKDTDKLDVTSNDNETVTDSGTSATITVITPDSPPLSSAHLTLPRPPLPLISPHLFQTPTTGRSFAFNINSDLLSPTPYAIGLGVSPFVPNSRHLDTNATTMHRPNSPQSLFSPSVPLTPFSSSPFPPSPSPRPPGSYHTGHWFSPSPMNSSNTGGPPVFLTLPNGSTSSTFALSSPSHALLSPMSFASPASLASTASSQSTESAHSDTASPSQSNTVSPSHSASQSAESSPSLSAAAMTTDTLAALTSTASMLHQMQQVAAASVSVGVRAMAATGGKSSASRGCNCKKSRCLKLYCECFARGNTCRDCNCIGCENTSKAEDQPKREKAVQQVIERDRNGFYRKHSAAIEQSMVNANKPPVAPFTPTPAQMVNATLMKMMVLNALSQQSANSPTLSVPALMSLTMPPPAATTLKVHPKGCHCKKSECLKKYCECFQAGLKCGKHCKCISCRNGRCDGHEDENPTIAALPSNTRAKNDDPIKTDDPVNADEPASTDDPIKNEVDDSLDLSADAPAKPAKSRRSRVSPLNQRVKQEDEQPNTAPPIEVT